MEPKINSLNTYEVKVLGQVDASWLEWFGAAQVNTEKRQQQAPVTTISNIISDQAGLVGLIRRLHGVGMVLLSVNRLNE